MSKITMFIYVVLILTILGAVLSQAIATYCTGFSKFYSLSSSFEEQLVIRCYAELSLHIPR